MSKPVKNVLKFLLFLGIGVGLIYLSIRGISFDQLKQDVISRSPNYWWIVASMAAGILSHWVRAMRWRMLIEPFDKKPSRHNAFFAVIIGYMANYAPLPRLGEVYRCVILNRYEKTPFTELVGTIVVERALDLLMMGLFFVVMLLLRAEKVYNVVMSHGKTYFHDKLEWLGSHIMLIAAVVVFLIGATMFLLKKKKDISDKIKGFLAGFWDGIKGISKLKTPVMFCLYTVTIWLLYLLAAYFCFFCFADTSSLTLADGFVILIFGAVGVIVSPGGTGAYQVLVGKVFEYIYHFTKTFAAAMAWILWGSQFVLIITLGLISFILLPILNKNDKTGSVATEGAK